LSVLKKINRKLLNRRLLVSIMAETPQAAAESTSKYDLTSTLSKYLDLHLMFPLLEFIDGNELLKYNHADIERARLALLKPTNMVEYAIEIHQSVEGTEAVPSEMEAQREAVYKQIEEYEKQDGTVQTFFADLVMLCANNFDVAMQLSLKHALSLIGGRKVCIDLY
jgi:translation initiation factor 3 subunit E